MNGNIDGLGASPDVQDPFHDTVLELNDGSIYSGLSFGAVGKSVAGECVFQTGKAFAIISISYLDFTNTDV